MRSGAYGGNGQRLRHALVDDDEAPVRRGGVSLMLALALWLDEYLGSRALDRVSLAIEEQIHAR